MIFSIIISFVFFIALAVWLVRFIGEAGVKYPDNKILKFLTLKKEYVTLNETATTSEYLKIFIYAIVFRIVIFLLGWLACGIFQRESVPTFMEYCNKWNIWDGPHYIDIATNGYSHAVDDGRFLLLAFFPLYPLLIKLLQIIVRNYIISGLIVSFICYSLGCVLMYKLVIIDYSKEIARKSVIFLSIAPFTFFFGSVMTESTFFLFVIATFYAIRRHNWWLAGILGMLSALSRSVGVLMVIPAAVEWVQINRPVSLIKSKKWSDLIKQIFKVLPVLIIPVGTLIYLYINYYTAGDPFIFMQYQKDNWSQNLQFFGKTIKMIFEHTFSSGEDWTLISCLFMPGLIGITLSIIVIVYSLRNTRSMYVIFMLVYFAYNAGASWPLSLCRYLAGMFPMYWILASFTHKHTKFELPVTAIMAIIFGIYLTGYITCHQIM